MRLPTKVFLGSADKGIITKEVIMRYFITKIKRSGFEMFEAKITNGTEVLYIGTHFSHGGAKQSIVTKLRSL